MSKKIIDIEGLDTFKSELIKDNISASDSTYSSNKIGNLLDTKTDMALIAEEYDSTKTYKSGSVFFRDGVLLQATQDINSPSASNGHYEEITATQYINRLWIGTEEELPVSDIPTRTFVLTTDTNEIIWVNSVRASVVRYNESDSKYYLTITETLADIPDGLIQYGAIIAKNDLTGIENIDDATILLKVEKINNEYVATYANSAITVKHGEGERSRNYNVSFSKGTSNIAYIRGYAIFKNTGNDDTVLYTPVQQVKWEE